MNSPLEDSNGRVLGRPRPLLFAACDGAYFEQFGPGFCKSALTNGHDVHVHVINPGADFVPPARRRLTVTLEHNAPRTREYYASSRFRLAPQLLSELEPEFAGLLILDIDSIIRGPISPFDFDVGIFRRPRGEGLNEWAERGSRVAAGIVYYARGSEGFASSVCKRLDDLPDEWFADQVALAETADEFEGRVRMADLAAIPDLFDLHAFDPGSLIWSGKGRRKYERADYVEQMHAWSDTPVFGDELEATRSVTRSTVSMRASGTAPKVLIARPRLDCSFKPGPVPDVPGPPLNPARRYFGRLIDQLAEAHVALGHEVEVDERPLWHFSLEELQAAAPDYDRVYFPHKQAEQFPIGDNAYYYKNAAFPEWLTVDRDGWGASMSWSPLPKTEPTPTDWRLFGKLQARITHNVSLFDQPPAGDVEEPGYLLFVCQLPHDETIKFHSEVRVETALAAVLAYAEATRQRVLVKSHPAGRKGMGPLREAAEACPAATWVERASVHSCLAGASTVYLVNSGVGFEAMLHDKPIVRFGEAEYSSVVPKAEPTVESLAAHAGQVHRLADYVGFIGAFRRRCMILGDAASGERIATIEATGAKVEDAAER